MSELGKIRVRLHRVKWTLELERARSAAGLRTSRSPLVYERWYNLLCARERALLDQGPAED
jgi:hypothetical protein